MCGEKLCIFWNIVLIYEFVGLCIGRNRQKRFIHHGGMENIYHLPLQSESNKQYRVFFIALPTTITERCRGEGTSTNLCFGFFFFTLSVLMIMKINTVHIRHKFYWKQSYLNILWALFTNKYFWKPMRISSHSCSVRHAVVRWLKLEMSVLNTS